MPVPSRLFSLRWPVCCLGILLATLPTFASRTPHPAIQTAAPGSAASAGTVSALLQPSLAQVQQTVGSLNIKKWHMAASLRTANQENAASVQRDLEGPLPGLVQQADASPGSLPALFAVYRNVDALYDVVLRIAENANFGAPTAESAQLRNALSSLEQARGHLSDLITHSAQTQQTEFVRLQAAIRVAQAPQTPVKTTVVEDYATKPTEHHRVRHHTTAKPAGSTTTPKPTPSTPQ